MLRKLLPIPIIICLLPFLLLVVNCTEKPVNWPSNETIIYAKKFKLEISDTSKILIKTKDTFSLLSPPDSLLISEFEITYSSPDKHTSEYFKTKANQQVINSLNSKVTEYYSFDKGNVLFLGYSTSDTLKPVTLFEPPLIISPAETVKPTKSSGMMKTFFAEDNSFNEGFNTNLKIKEINQINLKLNKNNSKVCSLRELTLSRDATVGFGENNLIMPGAIMLKTKLLVDLKGLPMAEWSLKTERADNEIEKNLHEQKEQKDKQHYIELTKYTHLTN